MQIIEPEIIVTFWKPEDGRTPEQMIEEAGRICYQSEDKIKDDSAEEFVRRRRTEGHHAMLEFGYVTARIIADRGLTHELVRHRLASYAQESTRYCNYSKGKHGSEITVVEQPGLEGEPREVWRVALEFAEDSYMNLIRMGVPAQIARSVLPIGLRAEITLGANTREWRHIFTMRCAKHAHPIIRGVMLSALKEFNAKMPALFEDLAEKFLEDK